MYKITYQASESPESPESPESKPAKQPLPFKVMLIWVASHLLLFSPALILFLRAWTFARNDPGACLMIPLLIIGAFAAQALGVTSFFFNFKDRSDWLVAAGVSLAVGLVIVLFTIFKFAADTMLSPLMITGIGVVLGALEAVVLRPISSRAWWWVAANAAGFALGLISLTWSYTYMHSLCGPDAGANIDCRANAILFSSIFGVAVFSLITGATLQWIARPQTATTTK